MICSRVVWTFTASPRPMWAESTPTMIKQYIEEKYGFKVHSAYIGQVREKLGIREYENYYDSHTSPRKTNVCPEKKETAIIDALKYFGLIE